MKQLYRLYDVLDSYATVYENDGDDANIRRMKRYRDVVQVRMGKMLSRTGRSSFDYIADAQRNHFNVFTERQTQSMADRVHRLPSQMPMFEAIASIPDIPPDPVPPDFSLRPGIYAPYDIIDRKDILWSDRTMVVYTRPDGRMMQALNHRDIVRFDSVDAATMARHLCHRNMRFCGGDPLRINLVSELFLSRRDTISLRALLQYPRAELLSGSTGPDFKLTKFYEWVDTKGLTTDDDDAAVDALDAWVEIPPDLVRIYDGENMTALWRNEFNDFYATWNDLQSLERRAIRALRNYDEDRAREVMNPRVYAAWIARRDTELRSTGSFVAP